MYVSLINSTVRFNQEAHSYTSAEGKPLKGITGILSRQLFPTKYDTVPDFILKRAAERGTFVHENVELKYSLGVTTPCEEAEELFKQTEKKGWDYEKSEYLISDETRYASSIDVVYRTSDDTFILADVKTTYKYDAEYVRWQLSIYAYLFERQNPDAKVGGLYGLWLRDGKVEMHKAERIPVGTVKELLDTDWAGGRFVNPYGGEAPQETASKPVKRASKKKEEAQQEDTLPAKYREMMAVIREIDEMQKYWEGRKKELLEGIKTEMDKAGVSSWRNSDIAFTRTADSVRQSFDTTTFKVEHPDLYEHYLKTAVKAGSITMKLF
jgi:hypothetical protein